VKAESRDIDDQVFGDHRREALDHQGAGHEVDESALGLDADGFADELDRNLDPDRLVHVDLDQIGVNHLVRQGIDLDVLDHDVALSVFERNLEEGVQTGFRLENPDDVLLIHDKGLAGPAFAVKNGWNPAGLSDAVGRVLAERLAGLGGDRQVHGSRPP
jgi:hypothetical protein